MSLKRTLLFEEHVNAGAKIVPFAGYEMPVEYEGLRAEHNAVRTAVGLFDVSHMGEIWFRGPKALESLQWLTTNDVSKLKPGMAHYSLLPNDKGGLVDDIIIYCTKEQEYMVCVNAANIEKDEKWMRAHNKGAEIKDESGDWSQIAIQGPKARELTSKILGSALSSLGYFKFLDTQFQGARALVACTGYTGEDGFEVFIENKGAVALWRELLKVGAPLGVKPIGLGARDTLRTEMKYSLYGHEITDETNPIEAGLGWVVKPQKGDFIGKSLMVATQEKGPSQKLVGFKMVDKGIARGEYAVLSATKQKIGVVTSGTLSPSLNEAIGIAYVPTAQSVEGTELWIDIRGRPAKAVVVKTPFVNPKK
ncbi:MAG: glycine cleavage system aminomethyltransferase GcvT [Bdellovibrionales bacterium]